MSDITSSTEEIEWARDFLRRNPGPSDPREFEFFKDDWIRAKKIIQSIENKEEKKS